MQHRFSNFCCHFVKVYSTKTTKFRITNFSHKEKTANVVIKRNIDKKFLICIIVIFSSVYLRRKIFEFCVLFEGMVLVTLKILFCEFLTKVEIDSSSLAVSKKTYFLKNQLLYATGNYHSFPFASNSFVPCFQVQNKLK